MFPRKNEEEGDNDDMPAPTPSEEFSEMETMDQSTILSRQMKGSDFGGVNLE